jgi:hypothetical protein
MSSRHGGVNVLLLRFMERNIKTHYPGTFSLEQTTHAVVHCLKSVLILQFVFKERFISYYLLYNYYTVLLIYCQAKY